MKPKLPSNSSGSLRLALLAILALASFALFLSVQQLRIDTRPLPESLLLSHHQSQWNAFVPDVERALKIQAKEKQPSKLDLAHVYGGVVPHHIPTTIPELVRFYSRLKQAQEVRNFIVIGPDHTDAGMTPISISAQSFVTQYGEVKSVIAAVQKLQEGSIAAVDESPFDPEHSIGSQMLIISKIFPDARVTPIILRSDATLGHAEALGKAIAGLLDDETVLIASVDFSHYLSTEQAAPIDRLSGQVVRNLDMESLKLIKADSSRSMAAFMTAMIAKNAFSTSDVEVLNTNDLMQNSDYTTGYVFGYWGVK